MFSSGCETLCLEDVFQDITESEIIHYYLGITEVPCVINSPLRVDNNPSFGLNISNNGKIYYKDFATQDSGDVLNLLSKMWNLPFSKVLSKLQKDKLKIKQQYTRTTVNGYSLSKSGIVRKESSVSIKIKIREWQPYDIKYWESYGISLKWLQYAEVYPISHKIVIKNNKVYTFRADKYAYAFIERKEDKITLKLYQPFNKRGFKWSNTHNASVISLWTKVPPSGNKLCICSSLKDALCLWENTGIPSIAIQGEGYSISQTAINNLKTRYDKVYILLDNDKVGLTDGEKLSKETGFNNLVLPFFKGGKDISDLYYNLKDKQKFKDIILPLFNN